MELIFLVVWYGAVGVFAYLIYKKERGTNRILGLGLLLFMGVMSGIAFFRIELLPGFMEEAGFILGVGAGVIGALVHFSWMPLAGMAATVAMFSGLRRLRDYKILADTPLIPIRSVSLGLTKIRGKAQSDQLILSPVSHTPCCFYKIEIEVTKGDGEWKDCLVRWNGPRFFLADDSGKALIDARNVDDENYDVPQSYQCEMNGEALSAISELRRPRRVVNGLSRIDRVLHTHFHEKADRHLAKRKWSNDAYRLQEFLVLPGEEYQVTGTCVENPDSNGADDRNLICKDDRVRSFAISATMTQGLRTKLQHYFAIQMIVCGAIGTLVFGYLSLGRLRELLGLFEK